MNFRARNREVANALNRPKEVLTRPLHRLIQTTLSSQRAWGKKLLSLVTFFAAAKKVTPPPGRRLLHKKPKQAQPSTPPLLQHQKILIREPERNSRSPLRQHPIRIIKHIKRNHLIANARPNPHNR